MHTSPLMYTRDICERSLVSMIFWDTGKPKGHTWNDYVRMLDDYPFDDAQAKKLLHLLVKGSTELQTYNTMDFMSWAMSKNVAIPNWIYDGNTVFDRWDVFYRMCMHYAFGDEATQKIEQAKILLKDPAKKTEAMQLIHSITPPVFESPESMLLSDVIDRTVEATRSEVLALPTGLSDLDEYMYFEPGGVYFLGARPSVGKTTVALNMAMNLAYKHNKKVLYMTSEMDDVALARRILSRYTQLEYSTFLSPLNAEAKRRVGLFNTMVATVEREHGGKLVTEPIRAVHIDAVEQLISYHVTANQVEYVFVDYIGHIMADGKTEYEQTTTRSNRLRQITARHGIVMVALMQLNRQADGKDEFTMSMARSSGQQEADAHGMIFLKRGKETESEEERSVFGDSARNAWKTKRDVTEVGSNEIGFDILKNRNGRLGAFTQLYIPEHFFVGGRPEYDQHTQRLKTLEQKT